jgi:ubiquinone/menaquinone biosynthesis C-methylase UbiE
MLFLHKIKKIKQFFKKRLAYFNQVQNKFKQQPDYEIINISFIPKKNQHQIKIKLLGKAHRHLYAQELAADDRFIQGLSHKDIRTVVYLAACDQLAVNKKIEPMYRLFRAEKSSEQEKCIGIEHTITGEKDVKLINEVLHPQFLDRLHVLDVYQLGYMVGQQSLKDFNHLQTEKASIFSYEPSCYTTFRPKYPQALFDYLHQQIDPSEIVLDCGAGSGQSTEALAHTFEHVVAIDASYELLSRAPKLSNVFYLQSFAEKLPLASHSIGLICVAQAAHWFELDNFYEEVKRVLKPGGMIAIWCYNQAIITSKVDAVVADIYEQVRCNENPSVARQYVYEAYQTLPFPFQKISTPSFEMTVNWDYHQWLGYMKTWPSILEYEKRFDTNLIENTELALRHAWGNEGKKRVTWPIYLKMGLTKF